MKKIIYLIISAVTFPLYKLNKGMTTTKTSFYLSWIKKDSQNKLSFIKSKVNRSQIYIKGSQNEIISDSSLIDECLISIQGENNKIQIKRGVKLRKAKIFIRGENCRLTIGEGTTFGQIRIVNVGLDNIISIGSNCLFADNIEIWASDTHSIYNNEGVLINQEKPIIIGNNIWVGAYVKILKGVNINDGAVIGMNSMVTKDIEPRSLNVGSPIKRIKENITWSLDYKIK